VIGQVEARRYYRVADQFAQTSSTYRSERLALLRTADLSLHFADASFARGEDAAGDDLLEAANALLDDVFSLAQRAGQWLVQNRTANFLAGVFTGATGLPTSPTEGLEHWYYVGAGLGSVLGMVADTWFVLRGLTMAAGGTLVTVTTAGVAAPIAVPVALAGLAQVGLGSLSFAVHYDRFKEAFAEAKAGDAGPSAGGQRLQSLTKKSFRENLKRLTGFDAPTNIEAHHVLPATLDGRIWKRFGINVHNPKYGAWWDKAVHRVKSAEYNRRWDAWLDDPVNDLATAEDMLAFAKELAKEYNLIVHF